MLHSMRRSYKSFFQTVSDIHAFLEMFVGERVRSVCTQGGIERPATFGCLLVLVYLCKSEEFGTNNI
ncbi:hypothetical protein L596_002819 [Steinernema carpocapsae]|uniref:Uncharacterized protein n=1 Tax=Steinernema carpocapsae TaxID=34508 RepID=A0A4U8UUF4_STECR|nr:hypothetical protein L596_002819 [Steinernema carpocapsae]